jgi:hypothetical protein
MSFQQRLQQKVGILAVCLLLPHLPDLGLNETSDPYLETEAHPRLSRPAYFAITEIVLPESSLLRSNTGILYPYLVLSRPAHS